MAADGTIDWRPSGRMDALRNRAEMLRKTRAFFARRHVLEVQTPVLGTATVTDPAIDSMRLGAAGRYLQTSPEYHMKRLLAAGAPSIYQLGPVFRAGEQGRWHNPEFTLLEWYRLGFDAAGLMAELSDLVDNLLGPGSYRSRAYADLIGDRFGVAPTDTEACLETARHLGLGTDADPEQALDLLLAHAIASSGEQRLYITGFPPDQAALARLADDGTASRFELVIDGVEVANGYHELCDASELKRRMAADNVRRSAAGRPEIEADARLVAAQRQGLPDCAGVAVGFDRLVALHLGVDSVAEAMAFDWSVA